MGRCTLLNRDQVGCTSDIPGGQNTWTSPYMKHIHNSRSLNGDEILANEIILKN